MFHSLYPAFRVEDSSQLRFLAFKLLVGCENVGNLGLYKLKGFKYSKYADSWS